LKKVSIKHYSLQSKLLNPPILSQNQKSNLKLVNFNQCYIETSFPLHEPKVSPAILEKYKSYFIQRRY